MLCDCGYPSFWNVDSAIPIDVVEMKFYLYIFLIFIQKENIGNDLF